MERQSPGYLLVHLISRDDIDHRSSKLENRFNDMTQSINDTRLADGSSKPCIPVNSQKIGCFEYSKMNF